MGFEEKARGERGEARKGKKGRVEKNISCLFQYFLLKCIMHRLCSLELLLLWLATSVFPSGNSFALTSPPLTHGTVTVRSKVLVCNLSQQPCTQCTRSGHISRLSPLMAGGFGASKGGSDRAVTEAPGSTEAKIALESSGGDLNKATSMVFQRRLQKLQEEDEELGAMLTELSTGKAAA